MVLCGSSSSFLALWTEHRTARRVYMRKSAADERGWRNDSVIPHSDSQGGDTGLVSQLREVVRAGQSAEALGRARRTILSG